MSFNGVVLNISNMRTRIVPSTIKQKIGRNLVKIPIIGRDATDFNLEVEGLIIENSLAEMETARASIETLNDCEAHDLVTGISTYDTTYIMEPDSLEWTDSSDDAQGLYRYRFVLVEFNQ